MTCFAQARNVLTHIHTYMQTYVQYSEIGTRHSFSLLIVFSSALTRYAYVYKIESEQTYDVIVCVCVPWYTLHGMPSTSIRKACMWVNKFQIKFYRTHFHVLMKHELQHEHKRNIDMCLWLKYSRDILSHQISPVLFKTPLQSFQYWLLMLYTHRHRHILPIYLLNINISMLKILSWSCFSTFFIIYTFLHFFVNIFHRNAWIIWDRREGSWNYDKIW